jgi:hypothetical protein
MDLRCFGAAAAALLKVIVHEELLLLLCSKSLFTFRNNLASTKADSSQHLLIPRNTQEKGFTGKTLDRPPG